jgi:DNA polymerase III subunit delta
VKLSTRQLEGHLRKELGKLYTVHGAEALLALEAADRIRDAARKAGCTEREVFFAEPGVDWNRLGASAANLSLFASKRLVELRIPTGKPGAEGGKAIDAWASRLTRGREAPAQFRGREAPEQFRGREAPEQFRGREAPEQFRGREAPEQFEDTVTLVLLPELEWQQQKSKWFESLEQNGVMVEAKPISRDELPDWLAERLARQQQRASVETLEWLAEQVEGNLLAAKQEVEKLALLLPAGEITLAAIRESVTDVSRFERDALLAAIHGDDPGRVARVVASLAAEGEPLPLLLWTLAEELRLLMAIVAGQRPRRFLPPDRIEALNRTAKHHNAASFHRELLRAHRIDRMIKGVETGNPWDNVVDLALGISGRPVMAEEAA